MATSSMMLMPALVSFTFLALASIAEGGVLFASINRTLVVTSEIQSARANSPVDVAKAGVDHLRIQWSLNSSFVGKDSTYSDVNIKLCFAPPSQVGRGWRKTTADLHTDKTCAGATIAKQKYTAAGNSTVWMVKKEVPGALYFVRAYAVDANGVQLAYGQTTNKAKTTNIFSVDPSSGRHTSMDIASAVFSVVAIGALLSYLGIETLLAKRKERLSR